MLINYQPLYLMKANVPHSYPTYTLAVIFCGLFLTLIVVSEVDAQGLKKLRNAIGKVEDKVQERTTGAIENYIDSRISQETEKTLNKWFGVDMQSSQTSQSGNRFSGFGMDPNAITESVYEFDFKISHYMETVEKGKSTKFRMITYINSEHPYYAIQMTEIEGITGVASGSAQAYMIMDAKNSVMLMLVNENGQQSSMVFSQPGLGMDVMTEDRSDMAEEYNATMSGSGFISGFNAMSGYESLGSRTISGFDAKGFRTQDGRSKIDIWLADQPIKGYKEMMSASASVPMMAMFAPYSSSGGMLVEITAADEASNSKTIMRIEDGSGAHKHSIVMSQWPRMRY
jgi:hypothetical protein